MIKKNRLWAFILMMSMLVGLMPNIVYAAKWQYLETPPEFQNILFQSTGDGGEGEIDWLKVTDALKDIEYNGVWMYEAGFQSRNGKLAVSDFKKNAEKILLA